MQRAYATIGIDNRKPVNGGLSEEGGLLGVAVFVVVNEAFVHLGEDAVHYYGIILAGMCGSDLARRVLEATGRSGPYPEYQFTGYSQEYWAGWRGC